MRRLTLVRHAKSSWDDDSVADKDRPLSARGERDAPYMASRLKARSARPSLIVTSPATRALTTARILARELSFPNEFLQTERDLYLAPMSILLNVIARQDDRCADLLLVGHNPGLTELANHLVGDYWLDNLPTSGVVALDCDVDDWRRLDSDAVELAYLDYPKNPAAVQDD